MKGLLETERQSAQRRREEAEDLRKAIQTRDGIIEQLEEFYGTSILDHRRDSGDDTGGDWDWDLDFDFVGALDDIDLQTQDTLDQALGQFDQPVKIFAPPPQILIPDFGIATDEAIAYLAEHPEYMHELHHRRFEEMLAELFTALGYEVELGRGSADGGIDLRLQKQSEVGPFVVLIQAKRWRRRPVSLEYVQALNGALDVHGANKGILATTSRFLPCAKKFADQVAHRLLLAGPNEITAWLREAASRSK